MEMGVEDGLETLVGWAVGHMYCRDEPTRSIRCSFSAHGFSKDSKVPTRDPAGPLSKAVLA